MKTACVLVPSPQHASAGHPEGPERFSRLGDWESKPYSAALEWLGPGQARPEELLTVHSEAMVHFVEQACQQGPGFIDQAPTYVTAGSFEAALNAAGGALECTRAVLDGRTENAFAMVRPPGHHAEPERAMGFCLFNNVALAARSALQHGLQKLLIVDFDVHHGNGTQAAFRNEPRVAYFSTHQEGIYPGSGQMEEAPEARGRLVNLPLPPRAGSAAFTLISREVLPRLVERFQPEMLLVSAGFDAHWDDPLAAGGLSSAEYFTLAERLVGLAQGACRGRIVFVLEGGYHPTHLATGVEAVLAALTGSGSAPKVNDPSPYPEPDIRSRVDRLLHYHHFI